MSDPVYLVSRCGTIEEFVAAFRRYADRLGVFVPCATPVSVGRRARFAITLSTGAIIFGQDQLAIHGPGRHALRIEGGATANDGLLVHLGFGTLIVQQLATLDELTNGRMEAVVSTGNFGLMHQYHVDWAARKPLSRLKEAMHVMRTFLDEGKIDFKGDFFEKLRLGEEGRKIAEPIIREISARLGFMVDVGLGYLTLDRKTGSLSGGERQPIKLANQVGSGLVGFRHLLD